jgi:Arc/MetJ-type ribon-helix-helix transcriptional regulator
MTTAMTAHADSIKAVNVRLPKDVINLLDFLVRKGLYSSRAEAIRDFARDYANAHYASSDSTPKDSLSKIAT